MQDCCHIDASLCMPICNFQGAALHWVLPILQDALRHIYQRALMEAKMDILEVLRQVSLAVVMETWLGIF